MTLPWMRWIAQVQQGTTILALPAGARGRSIPTDFRVSGGSERGS
jgi:hypothetical protein